jgi:TatD family-associated radical SAM protein
MVDSLGGADSLWLKREPTMEEILELLDQWDLNKFEELVFCGYGEPTERLPELIETAEYARSKAPGLKIRLNTNGLSDLINGRDTLPELSSVLDRISVSLNAKGPEEYLALCHPRFGIGAFEAMLDFTRRAKECIPDVTMSVVSGSIPYQDIEPCRRIAEEEIGVKFRVR